jgi:endoglucanase
MMKTLTTASLWTLVSWSVAGCSGVTSEQPLAVTLPLAVPGLFFQGQSFSGAERGFGASLEESWGAAIPGVEGQTYSWPTPADKKLPTGMNIVRLPFQWERLQPTLNGDFDPEYLAKLHSTAAAWRDIGANVLLDVHNYAYYKVKGRGTSDPGQHIGSADVPIASFADFWRRMALEFGSGSTSSPFIFGLMNEPHDIEVAVWVDAAQQALDAIRATDAKNPVFVPGADWTTANDFSWSANASKLQSVTDPLDNFAIEVHQYYDGGCTATCYVDKLKPFEDWAVQNDRVAFLGEMDLTDETAACQEAFSNLIDHLHEKAAGKEGGVWVGYAYWEGDGLSAALPFIEPHLPSTCDNGSTDGDESDVDCGATCLRCANGKACAHDYDCQSGFCAAGACAAAGDESGSAGAAATGGATSGGGANVTGGTTSSAGTAAAGETTAGGGAQGTGGTTSSAGGHASGGTPASGGSTDTGGPVAPGGKTGTGGASGTGATTSSGTVATGGVATGGREHATGGESVQDTGGGPASSGGQTGAGPASDAGSGRRSTGCSCLVASQPPPGAWLAAFVALPFFGLRRRRTRTYRFAGRSHEGGRGKKLVTVGFSAVFGFPSSRPPWTGSR